MNDKTRTITVTGYGSVSAPPDLVRISVTLTSLEMECGGAMDAAAGKLETLKNALESAGFSPSDLKTASLRVDMKYENISEADGAWQRRFAGYACTHRLALELDTDMDRLARALPALADSGADPELYVGFLFRDRDALAARALAGAAGDASRRAAVLAKASGVSLGNLVSVDSRPRQEQAADTSVRFKRAGASLEGMEPEEGWFTAQATLVWEIR